MTATTALTAQNTQGVSDIYYIPSTFVSKQINACFDDIGVDVVKIGMLASASTVDAVAAALQKHNRPTCVLDPVMVSTSGSPLLPTPAITNLLQNLLPLTTILTPNIPESLLLLRTANLTPPPLTSLAALKQMACLLCTLGPTHVLVKGGHLPFTADLVPASPEGPKTEKRYILDILCSASTCTVFRTDYLASKHTHGTGCSLASAIAAGLAAGLARGQGVDGAVESAVRYVERGIRTAPGLGRGSGPIGHFHSVREVEGEGEGSTLRRIEG
ncbi:MAG: hypothetical protein Q9208_004035 [Pyrenodesmia sp. 3 TL-2023]